MSQQLPSNGMRTFFAIWGAQIVSVVGSQLSAFALGVWVYNETHSVTLSALSFWAFNVPQIVLSPLAGVMIDRWGRWKSMIISDFGAGLSVLAAALLYFSGQLQPWMIIPINLILSSFNCLMWPAQSAAITVLVPKDQYGRANGMVQVIEAVSQLAGPALAGMLYVALKVGNLAMIDFVTYIFAIAVMLAFVRIPEPSITPEAISQRSSMWQEMRFGWDYIVQRKGLFSLLTFFLLINLLGNMVFPLWAPFILDGWSPDVLGYISSILGVGMLAGTLVMSAWGGSKRKIYTLLVANVVAGLFLAAAGVRASIPLMAVCGFGFMFAMPLMNASSQAIWQRKVAPEIQGRVFAVRRTIAWSSGLISPLLAGPLADYVFKPLMAQGGALAPLLGPLIGVGASRGIGLMFIVIGLLTASVSIFGFTYSPIRRVELDIPDHEPVKTGEEASDLAGDQAPESVPA